MNEKCQKCGSPLVKLTSRKELKYKDKKEYQDFHSLKCSKCGNEIIEDSHDLDKAQKRFERSVDGYLDDQDIKRIRKKLGLTQREMAEKLGVGIKNFARYENLSSRQSMAMNNLLRIFDAYPEAFKIIDVNWQSLDSKNEEKKMTCRVWIPSSKLSKKIKLKTLFFYNEEEAINTISEALKQNKIEFSIKYTEGRVSFLNDNCSEIIFIDIYKQ